MESEENQNNIVTADSRQLKKYEKNIEILSTASTDEEEIDPFTYLQIIWKHRKIGLIFFFAVVATTIVISLLTKPMYLSRSTVEVALEKSNIVGFKDVLEANTGAPEFFNTQRDLIQSRAMAEAVLAKFNLWDHPDFFIWQTDFNPFSIFFSYLNKAVRSLVKPARDSSTKLEANKGAGIVGEANREMIKKQSVVNTFLDRVEVEPSEDSRIIYISFKAYSPQFAASMANAIADTFVDWSLDRRLEATRIARQFLQKQLDEVKVDLENSEHALHTFSVNNEILSLEKNENLIYRQLEGLTNVLTNTTSEKATKESLYKSVKSGNPNTIIEVINDPLIQNLKSEYNTLLVEYSDLSALFKPEYPPLKKLQVKIEAVRARLNEQTKTRVAAIESDYQTAVNREELLKQRVKEQQKLAQSLNEKTTQYRILDREVESSKAIYDSVLQRLKEIDVTGGIQSAGIQVVDHAFTPRSPFIPKVPRNLTLAVLVGLLGAVGIAFLREFLDRTIKTPEEIREIMRLPVLGVIFKFAENKNYAQLTVPAEKLYLADPRSPFSEAIRTVRASIMLSSRDQAIRSVLITSCWPGEGKTTVASNLALSLAFGTNRVLLVEADLRHPSIAKNFGIDDSKSGLSNYLMSYSDPNEIVHPTELPQLYVLPSGSVVPPNPSELLQSGGMNELLRRLKADFDYIILDSSPAIGIADSLVISTIVDATVVVASTGVTMRRDISHLVKQISDVNARFLGVVVNRVELGRDSYYYDRYYKNYYSEDITKAKNIDMKEASTLRQKDYDERGDLRSNSYASLIISFMQQKRTGVLNIDSQIKLRIYFLEGSPVFVEGGDNKTRLGSIAFSERKIKQEDYQKVLEKVAQTKKKIGEVLIEMGFISPHELDWLLEFQVKEKLVRGFECAAGSYSFKSRNDFVDDILIYKVNPLQVIYEGVKRYSEPVDIEKELFPTEKNGITIAHDPELLEKVKSIGFSPREYRFLQYLNRFNSLDDIYSINLLSKGDMLKLMSFLNSVGLIRTKIKEESQSAI